MNSRGWSVYQLSKRSKISKTAINGWFKEIPTKPNYNSIKQIAKAFGMTIEECFAILSFNFIFKPFTILRMFVNLVWAIFII